MLLFLFALARAEREFIGIDLGSQFYKMAQSTNDAQVKIWTDPETNSVINPSAAAVKFMVPHSLPLTERQFEDIDVRCGRRATPLLKHNSSLGFEFLPRTMARNRDSEFYTGKVANDTELFTLFLYDVVRKVAPFDALAISLPSYYTREQVAAVNDACRAFQMPLIAIVEDVVAVTKLYAALRLNRFIQSPKHVMFIDVGAMSTKAYSAVFQYVKNEETSEMALINMTTNEWSEEVGGYYFGKAIATAKNVSVAKGQKMLLRNNGEGYEQLFEPQLNALEQLLEKVMKEAAEVAPIDEVQLIGGASQFKFVVERIRKVTNHTIRRDFNANEAVAMGTVVTVMVGEGVSPYISSHVRKRSVATMNIACNDKFVSYCVKGEKCLDVVEIENLDTVCDQFSIIAHPSTIPAGTRTHMVSYELKTKPNFTGSGKLTAKFNMRVPDAMVADVEWCQGEECNKSEVTLSNPPPEGLFESVNFVRQYVEGLGNKGNRVSIRELLEKLNAWMEKIDKANVEATYPPTDEMRHTLEEINAMKEKDDFEFMDASSLQDVMKRLEKVADGLHVSR